MDKRYYVYILASRSRNLYTGVTNSVMRRVGQHREGRIPGFTSKYNIFRLVYYEVFGDIRLAIAREKEIKAWRRERKVWLIEKHNPTWVDLAPEWFGEPRKQPARQRTARKTENGGNIENTKSKEKSREKADPSPPSKIRPGSG